MRQGRRSEPYEEMIRDVLLTSPSGTFSFEGISDMPWIEIDFAVDIELAMTEVMPRILAAEGNRHVARMIKPSLVHPVGTLRLKPASERHRLQR